MWRKPEYPEKTTDLPLYYILLLSSTPHLSGIQTHNVSGNRHWGSYKYNYHTITTTMTPGKERSTELMKSTLIVPRSI